MAPTICSEKKPRQMRTNFKEIRRQPNSTTALLSSVAGGGSSSAGGVTRMSNGNEKATSNASSVMGYAPPTRNMRSCINSEIPNTTEHFSMQSMGVNRLRLESNQQQQARGNMVSSSQMRLEVLRAITANQMDVDSDITDEEDCEVHSITSGVYYNNNGNNNNTTSCSSINHKHTRQLSNCCKDDKTVFQAISTASMLSDKQNLITKIIANNNNNNKKHNNLRHYTCVEDEQSSDSYTSMCEIKNTEGLLAIALKTIKLVKRNQMLQRRLTELQLETSEFIESVLANPENRHFRDKMQSPVSSMKLSSATSSPLSSMSSSQSPQSITTTAETLGMTGRLSQSASEA